MRIVFNCLSLNKGGAERVITTLANSLSQKHCVSIITLAKAEVAYELNNNIEVIDLGKKSPHPLVRKISLIHLFRLRRAILREKPNIILSFLPEPSLKLMLIKVIAHKIRNIPVIVSIRNDPSMEFRNPIIYHAMRFLYSKADGFVFQTAEAKKYFKNILKKDTLQEIIPNPLAPEFIVDKPYAGKREKIIVSVGRLEAQKNHKLLINAFEEVHQKFPDYKLIIYGEGNLRESLENQIKSLGLTGFVYLPGRTNDVKNKIDKAACFVLSSDYEGMPNSLMEAMALGLPCVSTDCPCGGPAEIIQNGKNGLLVPAKNMNALADAMILVCKSTDIAIELSKNAHTTASQFDTHDISNKWLTIMKDVWRVKNVVR